MSQCLGCGKLPEAEGQAALRQFLDKAGLPPRQASLAELVFEELASNIIRHGYTDSREHTIEVRITLADDELVMHFEDDGKPFNPLNWQPAPLPASLDEAGDGGLGLFLVRKAAKSLRYERQADRNWLTVVIGLT